MTTIQTLEKDLQQIRSKKPLIHNITNFVVMNNTANALLAIGASPVMAHAHNEVDEMVKIASALVINIGTLDDVWLKAMIRTGEAANATKTPIIFDPVGAGATSYRIKACQDIINTCHPEIIRGNASEIIAVSGSNSSTKGVDSTTSSDSALDAAIKLADQTKSIVVISGGTDYITDGKTVKKVYNGHPMMEKVTGMGCTATAIVAAFAAVNPDYLTAAEEGMIVMGITGEMAAEKSSGNGSLQMNFLDGLYNLDIDQIKNYYRNK